MVRPRVQSASRRDWAALDCLSPGEHRAAESSGVRARSEPLIWVMGQKLSAADAEGGDALGAFVAVSADTIVAGAPGDDDKRGAAYVFERTNGTWAEQQKLIIVDDAAEDSFGSVSIDGDTIVVGAPGRDGAFDNSGGAFVFARTGSSWAKQQEPEVLDDVYVRPATMYLRVGRQRRHRRQRRHALLGA